MNASNNQPETTATGRRGFLKTGALGLLGGLTMQAADVGAEPVSLAPTGRDLPTDVGAPWKNYTAEELGQMRARLARVHASAANQLLTGIVASLRKAEELCGEYLRQNHGDECSCVFCVERSHTNLDNNELDGEIWYIRETTERLLTWIEQEVCLSADELNLAAAVES
jgi:hypothetical protein